jgi:SAM-dependent methyltransferase
MALYDLVSLKRNLVNAVNVDLVVKNLQNLIHSIATVKATGNIIDDAKIAYIDGLILYYNNLLTQVQQPVTELQDQIAIIDKEIYDITRTLFSNNYELEERYGTAEQVRTIRKIIINSEIEDLLKQRILLHTNWKYPALEIGCRDGEWTQLMVAADPLYVVDRHQEFLDSTAKNFNTKYQERLRRYLLKEDNNLSMLPQEQFAFVFSFGYFNYVSVDTITYILPQIRSLLRPGGTFLFSYNDGDTPAGAGLAENFARSYMPKSLLIPICQSFGFNITAEYDYDRLNLLEIQRPGTLQTVKAHQVLGKIMPRND